MILLPQLPNYYNFRLFSFLTFVRMKEAWKRQRDSSNTAQGLFLGKEPCRGGPQQDSWSPQLLRDLIRYRGADGKGNTSG
jgi:hypothetical protein